MPVRQEVDHRQQVLREGKCFMKKCNIEEERIGLICNEKKKIDFHQSISQSAERVRIKRGYKESIVDRRTVERRELKEKPLSLWELTGIELRPQATCGQKSGHLL